MLEREDTPWYPTLRLFRQAKPGDWAGLFARIAGELAKLVDEVSLSRARQKQAQP
jgi:hypothetical protein